MTQIFKELKADPFLGLIALGLWILPVSNAVGQVPLYLASVYWLVQALRGRMPVCWRTQGFLLAFAALILLSLPFAVHPQMGIDKLNRLLIFPLAGAVTAACLQRSDPSHGIALLALSLIGGVCLRGLYDLVKFPVEIFGQGVDFEHVGNMTSPQFYLMGLMLLLGLRAFRPEWLGRGFWWMLPLVLNGFLLHQKRGVWLAGLVVIGLWTLWMRHWKILLGLTAVAVLAAMLPFVQHRLERLQEVVGRNHGGRSTLWLEVAPRLIPEYPWGMGYNGTTYEDFREAIPSEVHLEKGLRHLHNNLLQIRLELGWQGLTLWTLWMATALWAAFRRSPSPDAALRHTLGFALLALLLNGMVEYNFGDSEILKTYLVLFGMLDVFGCPKAQAGDPECIS
jgi:O-antigen ligase